MRPVGRGPDLVEIDAASYRRTPWKNGGGTTIDIAGAYLPGSEPGGWSGMVWRFGRTRIETPAPFSDLSGHDRIIAIVGGRGLVLRLADGRELDVREPFRPVRFSGDWAIRSELECGPVEVLNLMGDRRSVDLDMRVLGRSDEWSASPGEFVLHAPLEHATVRIGGRSVAIPGDGSVRLSAEEPVLFEGETGNVAVAHIAPRGQASVPPR